MILFRCFPWDHAVGPGARGGALWFPRLIQGSGRHDNPLVYGCVYVSERELSAVVEQLARLIGTSLAAADLFVAELPLALAALELAENAEVIDLDQPRVLGEERLRPSLVATHERAATQSYAAALFERHPGAVALRWWSAFESQWINATLFDRAIPALAVRDVRRLTLDDDVVQDAADFLALPVRS